MQVRPAEIKTVFFRDEDLFEERINSMMKDNFKIQHTSSGWSGKFFYWMAVMFRPSWIEISGGEIDGIWRKTEKGFEKIE